jgi:hypothetical protein
MIIAQGGGHCAKEKLFGMMGYEMFSDVVLFVPYIG